MQKSNHQISILFKIRKTIYINYSDGKYGYGKPGELLFELTIKNNTLVNLVPDGFDNKELNNIYSLSVIFNLKGSPQNLTKNNSSGFVLVKF